MFELAASFPELNQYYGVLSGAVFALAYSFSGLFAG
jgi:hypothetical protein